MDMHSGWIVAVGSFGLCAASTATWAGCRWWYGRKLAAAALRLHKSDKGRLFSQQQALQARKQVEQLKVEIEAHRRASSDTLAAQRRSEELARALVEAERSVHDLAMATEPAPLRSGFADTQILP